MVGKVGKAVAAGVGGTILLINVCFFENNITANDRKRTSS